MACHVCGAEEIWSWLDCQPGDETMTQPGEWKRIDLCHPCWDRLNPDMWTCQEHYESLNPVIPYCELPGLPKDEKNDIKFIRCPVLGHRPLVDLLQVDDDADQGVPPTDLKPVTKILPCRNA